LKSPIIADLSAATITLDHAGVSENTYRARGLKSQQTRDIYAQLVSVFPAVLEESPEDWELLGVSEANGDNYRTPTISVFYKGPPPPERREKYGVPSDLFLVDAHAVKYELASGQSYLKVYRGDWWQVPLPGLPEGACLASNYGLGCHFQKPELASRRDVYFFHDNEAALNSWLVANGIKPVQKIDLPMGNLGLYGLQFDAVSLKSYRLKRYYQPHAPVIVDRLNL
jgi:hypothetical protein